MLSTEIDEFGIMLDSLSSTIALITQWRLYDSEIKKIYTTLDHTRWSHEVWLLPSLLDSVWNSTLLGREDDSVMIDTNLP